MGQTGQAVSELSAKQLGSALKVEYAILATITGVSCDVFKEGGKWVEGKYGAWQDTRFHSFYATREDAEDAFGRLFKSTEARRADPSDPSSPDEYSETTSYRLVPLEDFSLGRRE